MQNERDDVTTGQDVVISDVQRRILEHMLGCGSDIGQKNRGYRNHYFVNLAGQEISEFNEMFAKGLLTRGRMSNDKKFQYYHATRAGCKAIGMTPSEIIRALSD